VQSKNVFDDDNDDDADAPVPYPHSIPNTLGELTLITASSYRLNGRDLRSRHGRSFIHLSNYFTSVARKVLFVQKY